MIIKGLFFNKLGVFRGKNAVGPSVSIPILLGFLLFNILVFLEGVNLGNFYEFLPPSPFGLLLYVSLAVIGFGGDLLIRVKFWGFGVLRASRAVVL